MCNIIIHVLISKQFSVGNPKDLSSVHFCSFCLSMTYVMSSRFFSLILFADDTNLFCSHNNFSTFADKLSEWFKANRLLLIIDY